MTHYNTPPTIIAAMATPQRPISLSEFKEFWNSLSESEKEYYRRCNLKDEEF